MITGRDRHIDSIHAHHVRLGSNAGLSQKPSDYRTLPLTAATHDELHSTGEKSFYERNYVEHEKEVLHFMTRYIAEELPIDRELLEEIEQVIERRR